MITTRVSLTPASVLAVSISLLGGLPRSSWAVEVLVEQLAAEAPENTSLHRAVKRLRMRSPNGLLLDMAGKRVVKPVGGGTTAVYVIADGFAEQVAAAAVWLLSDAASYVSGISMPVDAGTVAR